MKDLLMVPAATFSRMRDRFKQQATVNSVLENVADLGATEQAILESNLPASMAIQMVEPLERRRRAQTKRLRTGGEVGTSYGANADEPEPMVNTPSEALVKKLLTPLQKKAKTEPHTRRRLPQTPSRIPTPSTSGLTAKKRAKSRLPTPKDYYRKGKKTPPGMKEAAIKGAKKAAAETFGLHSLFDSDDEEETLSARQRARRRDRELQRLDWNLETSPLRRRLGYDEERRGRPQQPHGWEAYQDDKRGKRPKKKKN